MHLELENTKIHPLYSKNYFIIFDFLPSFITLCVYLYIGVLFISQGHSSNICILFICYLSIKHFQRFVCAEITA